MELKYKYSTRIRPELKKINFCLVCGKRLGIFDGRRIVCKGECKGIYQNAYKRWQLGKDY